MLEQSNEPFDIVILAIAQLSVLTLSISPTVIVARPIAFKYTVGLLQIAVGFNRTRNCLGPLAAECVFASKTVGDGSIEDGK